MYLNGMRLGVDLETNTKNMCNQRDWTKYFIYASHSKFDSQHYQGEGPMWPFNEHANIHFDNE